MCSYYQPPLAPASAPTLRSEWAAVVADALGAAAAGRDDGALASPLSALLISSTPPHRPPPPPTWIGVPRR
jgi:hypothetical protein